MRLEDDDQRPFLRAPPSTLVMNVVSEMMASAGYLISSASAPSRSSTSGS